MNRRDEIMITVQKCKIIIVTEINNYDSEGKDGKMKNRES